MREHQLTAGLIAITMITGLAGCSAPAAPPATAPPPPSVRIIAPGQPGEPARVLGPDDLRSIPGPAPANGADQRYVERMIHHHAQALEMTVLAPERAANPQLRGLASRIHDTQGPEIEAMQAWLERGGLPVPDVTHPGGHGEHAGHGSAEGASDMPGMATPEQLTRLAAARGADFDRLFVTLMTAHHQGAVTMATEVLGSGRDVVVEEMAQDVIAVQSDEIQSMRTLAGGT